MAEFARTITGINNGNTETELSLRLKELVQAVSDTGKKGALLLKLLVERNKKNARLIEITAEVKTNIPAPPAPTAAFFLHNDRLIALEDTQLDLPFERRIQSGPVEVEPQPAESAGFREVEN